MTEPTLTEKAFNTQNMSESYEARKAKLDELRDVSQRLEKVKDEYATLCRAINDKNKELRTVQSSIDSHEFTLSRMNEKFDKENAEKLRIINSRQKEVDEASNEYQWLLKGVREKTDELENNLQNVANDKLINEAEVKKWKIYAEQVKSEADKRVIDVKKRESLLKERMEQFEVYKLTINPAIEELKKIREENILTKQVLSSKSLLLEKEEKHLANQREKLMSDVDIEKEKVRQELISIDLEKSSLAKRKQDLDDLELEVRAVQAEAEKEKRRYQLNKSIELNKAHTNLKG